MRASVIAWTIVVLCVLLISCKPIKSARTLNSLLLTQRKQIDTCSLLLKSVYSSTIKPENMLWWISLSFKRNTCFATMSINSFWYWSWVYFLSFGSVLLRTFLNTWGSSFPCNSNIRLKFSLPPWPWIGIPWRPNSCTVSITFLKYFLSVCLFFSVSELNITPTSLHFGIVFSYVIDILSCLPQSII